MYTITSDVPQGSILGPLLFLLYVKDFPNCLNHFSTIMFADDTSIFVFLYSHLNIKIIIFIYIHANEDLNSIYKWLCTNKLSLNYAKTKFMLFQTAHSKPPPPHLLLQVNEKKIEKVREINFLGITFTENLSWKTQMQKIFSKIRFGYYAIKNIRPYLNNKHLHILYYSMIQSHINYCTITWLHGNRVIANKIQKICNKFQKMLSSLQSRLNHLQKKLFNASDTKFTIYQPLIQKNALFMYQYHTNSLPKAFYNFFSKATNKNIVTKNNSQIISIHCSSTASMQSVKFWGPKVWNQIPIKIRESKTIHLLNKKIKPH